MTDLHIGYQDFGDRFQTVINNLLRQKGNEAGDYVVIISGDLSDDANVPQYHHEAKEGIDTLKREGFEHVLVIPGNHDYGTGSLGDKRFVKPFQEIFYGDTNGYPRKDIIEEVAFIGLDSIAEELNWHDKLFAEGELGKEQLKRLGNILRLQDVRDCKKRVVYLHHHPFKWRLLHQLKDSRKLKEVLVKAMEESISIDVLLFGHNHEGGAHNGEWGIPRCYDGGTATLRPRPKLVEKLPWFQIKESTRVILIGEDDVNRDYELPLLELVC